MSQFFFGALAMGCFVIGLFFLKFWRLSRDRLFAYFFVAFWLFCAEWCLSAISEHGDGVRNYWIRLLAFVLIIAGVLEKNRRGAR